MDGKWAIRTVAIGLLAFQASLGYVMFGVYGPRDFPPDFPFGYSWWPVEVGVFAVPFIAGLVLPRWRMLGAVLFIGAIGAIAPAVVLHGWPWVEIVASLGLFFSVAAALLFGAAVMLRRGAEAGIRLTRAAGSPPRFTQ